MAKPCRCGGTDHQRTNSLKCPLNPKSQKRNADESEGRASGESTEPTVLGPDRLPTELKYRIARCISDGLTLVRLSFLNRDWNRVTNDERRLWKPLTETYFPDEGVVDNYKKNFIALQRNICTECDSRTIDGVYFGLYHICRSCRADERFKCMTKTRAKQEYGLTEAEIGLLPHRAVQNPHYKRAAPMILLLESHVINLAESKPGGIEGLKQQRAARELSRKVKAEERELKRQKQEQLKHKRREKVESEAATKNIPLRLANPTVLSYVERGRPAIAKVMESLVRDARVTDEFTRRGWGDHRHFFDNYIATGEDDWDELISRTQDTVDRLAEEERRREDRKTRLVEALGARGLSLRSDSHLCSQYIKYGEGSIPAIVLTMFEMKFLYQVTDYATRPRLYQPRPWRRRWWDGESDAYSSDSDDGPGYDVEAFKNRVALDWLRRNDHSHIEVPARFAALYERERREQQVYTEAIEERYTPLLRAFLESDEKQWMPHAGRGPSVCLSSREFPIVSRIARELGLDVHGDRKSLCVTKPGFSPVFAAVKDAYTTHTEERFGPSLRAFVESDAREWVQPPSGRGPGGRLSNREFPIVVRMARELGLLVSADNRRLTVTKAEPA